MSHNNDNFKNTLVLCMGIVILDKYQQGIELIEVDHNYNLIGEPVRVLSKTKLTAAAVYKVSCSYQENRIKKIDWASFRYISTLDNDELRADIIRNNTLAQQALNLISLLKKSLRDASDIIQELSPLWKNLPSGEANEAAKNQLIHLLKTEPAS